jgi:hypothetical protein
MKHPPWEIVDCLAWLLIQEADETQVASVYKCQDAKFLLAIRDSCVRDVFTLVETFTIPQKPMTSDDRCETLAD